MTSEARRAGPGRPPGRRCDGGRESAAARGQRPTVGGGFGPWAKTRVWLALDADALYVDRVLLGTPVLEKGCDAFVRGWLTPPGPRGRPGAEITFPAKGARGTPLHSRVVLVHR
jgi:hypothetical protein